MLKSKFIKNIDIIKILDKTMSVVIKKKYPHPLYTKIIKRSKKYIVHNNFLDINKYDDITILKTRPISKRKAMITITKELK